MSNMENFKNIIAEERRRAGMTQEAFATRLGITPQAVSKWENGVGYPDVTLFPAIAEVLNVPIQRLFGEDETSKYDEAKDDAILPPNYNGLPLIFGNGQRACYSDKAVSEIDEDAGKCLFRDGSEADVNMGIVTNRGRGEVRIYEVKDIAPDYPPAPAPTETSFARDEAHFDDLELSLSMACSARVVHDPAGCRVEATGDPEFIAALRVERRAGGLYVGFRSDQSRNYNGRSANNKLTVFTDAETGDHAKISISGAGNCQMPLRFRELELSIAGSGDIQVGDCQKAGIRIAGSGDVRMGSIDGDVKISVAGSGDVRMKDVGGRLGASIAGSGDVTADSAAHAECGISGSGDIVIKRLSQSLSVKIQGSGDIVCGGHVKDLTLNISGGGDFSGEKLTVDNAHLTATGSADIAIGTITGTSVEKLSKSSRLRVGKRGEA